MATITLPSNVHFMYEHALAHLELTQGYDLDLQWSMANPWSLAATNLNGQKNAMLNRAAYVGTLDGEESVYAKLVRPRYRGGEFNRTRSENQYLTHWIYPYKGKFHPQMIRAILNILGAEPGWRVADVFSGSGTTLLECQLLGIDAVGIEISPLCALLAKVKTEAWKSAGAIEPVVERLIDDKVGPEEVDVDRWGPGPVADFVQIARMVTFSDVSRRKRDAFDYFQKNLHNMLTSVKDMARAIALFGISPGETQVIQGDSRKLRRIGVKPQTIDAIVTSPPYSVALDYVENDEHALKAMGFDTEEIREDFIGVRGRGAKKVGFYEKDMKAVLAEMAAVLKPGGSAVMVVGNVTLQGQESLTTDDMVQWAEKAGLKFDRELPKIVWGLYNLVKDEKILFFRKEPG